MATVINERQSERDTDSTSTGIIIGVLIVVLLIILFLVFGLPYLRNGGTGSSPSGNLTNNTELPNTSGTVGNTSPTQTL